MIDFATRLMTGLCAILLAVLVSIGGVQAHSGHGHGHVSKPQTSVPVVAHVDVSDADNAAPVASAPADAVQPIPGRSYVTAAVDQASAPCHTGCGPGGCPVTGHTGCCCMTGSATTVEQYETVLLHTFLIAVRGFEMPALAGRAASPLDRPPKR